jgi:nitrous oxidase accessory protein NosD
MTHRIINTKKYFLNSLILIICVCITSSFLIHSDKKYLNKTISLKVAQESNDIAVSVICNKENTVQFYMFTVEGKLIKELTISGSKKVNITKLEKGVYIYDFFSNDEKLKSGQIELK